MRQTNGCINDIKESVEETLNALKAGKPMNFYEDSINELCPKLFDKMNNSLNPDKFELLVKRYMEKIGANSVTIPPKNEAEKEDYADADIIAFFDNIKVAILIQAKYHDKNTKTDDWAVEQIKRYKEQREDPECKLGAGEEEFTYIPWVISTCKEYTEAAEDMAKENNIRLINGETFAKMILEQGLKDIDLK